MASIPPEIDRLLPSYDFSSRYTRAIKADPATVWDAVTHLTAEELPLTRLLMRLRSAGRTRLSGPVLEKFPIPRLGGEPGRELVSGRVSRFWKLRQPNAPVPPGDPGAFTAFAEPGWAKAALSMRVEPAGAGSVLTFETRVQATDARARRAFAAYWLLIRAGGAGFIRLEMLRAVARRAEAKER